MTAQNIKRKKRSTKIKSCNKDEIYGKKDGIFYFFSNFFTFLFFYFHYSFCIFHDQIDSKMFNKINYYNLYIKILLISFFKTT